MQCSVLVVAFAAMFLTTAEVANAQQKKNEPVAVAGDTVRVAPKVLKSTSAQASAESKRLSEIRSIDSAAVAMAIATAVEESKYSPVPLAGQKDYFGPMNDYVNKFCRSYFATHNKTLDVVKTRGTDHFDVLDDILKKHNLPKELKYLAVIESALNNNARSHAGAVGPWQMMAATARLMGLSVSRKTDERTDWIKSTDGAAKYLTKLYEQMNDWLLVVAAYNSGPAPVLRAMRITGSKNFWDIKKYLPKETQGHVMAFVATASIFERLNDFIGTTIPEDFTFNGATAEAIAAKERAAKGIPIEIPAKPKFTQAELSQMAVIKIKEVISLDFMADELGIDKKQLKKWNEDYDQFIVSKEADKTYNLRLPKDKVKSFLDRKSYISTRSKKIIQEQIL